MSATSDSYLSAICEKEALNLGISGFKTVGKRFREPTSDQMNCTLKAIFEECSSD